MHCKHYQAPVRCVSPSKLNITDFLAWSCLALLQLTPQFGTAWAKPVVFHAGNCGAAFIKPFVLMPWSAGSTILTPKFNQTLTAAEATVRGRAFEDLGCLWWEEPLPADDIEGYAQLADALDIPIATGENLYTAADFARFFKRNALDIVQPDLRRGGGPTALLQIGHMADAFRIPYASHGGGPVQLNIMACLPHAMYLETGLIPEGSPLEIRDGHVNIPNGPGFSWE
jgi:L-alanine-DL-glutamate epimerase-like enolase superfamily enzyme